MGGNVGELPTEEEEEGVELWLGWLVGLVWFGRRLARNDEGGARIGIGAKKKSKRAWRNEGQAGGRAGERAGERVSE